MEKLKANDKIIEQTSKAVKVNNNIKNRYEAKVLIIDEDNRYSNRILFIENLNIDKDEINIIESYISNVLKNIIIHSKVKPWEIIF